MTIDDYSHYIWTLFLGAKEDDLDKFRILGRSLEKPTCVLIQANHGNRFEHRVQFGEFCEQHGCDVILKLTHVASFQMVT
jgi:hypothetical protein